MITVVCWKWKPEAGNKHQQKREGFSARHVNILRSMVERNYPHPHLFACVTDDWQGLHSSIYCVDAQYYFREHSDLGGCYRRLQAFDGDLAGNLFGDRFVSIDLDVVITGDLTQILGFQGQFRIWEDHHRRSTPYCGSLWGMKTGSREHVWRRFHDNPNSVIRSAASKGYIGTDQAVVSDILYPGEVTWGIQDGIYNFNTQIRRTPSHAYREDGKTVVGCRRTGLLPTDSTIVCFNGKFDPSHEQLWNTHPWIREHWHE